MASQFDQSRFLEGDLSDLGKLASQNSPRLSTEDAVKTPLDDKTLRDRVRRLQTNPQTGNLKHQVNSLVKDSEILRAEHKLLIELVDKTFNIIAMEKRVATEIANAILELRAIWLRLLLLEPECLTDEQHPAGQFIKKIISSSFSWNNSLGRAGEPYLNAVLEQIKWLNFSYLDDPGVFSTAGKALQKFIEQHNTKAQKLENRICDTAIGVIEAQKNRFIAIRQVNRLLGDKEHPVELIRFIQGPWKDSLQLARSQSQKPDDVSLDYAKLAGKLIWSVTADAQKDKAKFYKITEELKPQILEKLIALPSDQARELAIKPIKQLYLLIGQGSEIEISIPTPLAEDELMPGVNARITPQLLKRVREINVGQHFRIKTKDGKLRIIKLTLKSEDARMLVFTNFLGVKSLEMNFAEFAWLLSNNQAKAIQPADLYRLAWKKTLSDCVEGNMLSQNQAAPASTKTEAEAVAEPAVNQAAIASREKAISEAEQHIKTDVKTPSMPPELNVGSWIEYSDNDNIQKIKLAAHIAAMDRYVFVDRDGKKILQCNHKEVEELFIAGKMHLLEQGKRFDAFDQIVGKISSTMESEDG